MSTRRDNAERRAQRPSMPDLNDEAIRAEAQRLLAAEAEAIAQADERNPVLPSIRANPSGAATIVLERFFTKDGLPQLAYYRENWYSYYKRLWSLRTGDDIFKFVHDRLQLCRQVDSDGDVQDFVTSRANVSEIVFQIQNLVGIPSTSPRFE